MACWGANAHGQLGDGTTTDAWTPVMVTGLTGATSVVIGGEHTCALLGDGTVSCWGLNSSGQLGNGTTEHSLVPAAVTGLSGVTALAFAGFAWVATGFWTALAFRALMGMDAYLKQFGTITVLGARQPAVSSFPSSARAASSTPSAR